jgi:hypothetical protein
MKIVFLVIIENNIRNYTMQVNIIFKFIHYLRALHSIIICKLLNLKFLLDVLTNRLVHDRLNNNARYGILYCKFNYRTVINGWNYCFITRKGFTANYIPEGVIFDNMPSMNNSVKRIH